MIGLRTVGAVTAVVVGLLAVAAPTALAAGQPVTKTVAAEIVIEHGSRPGKPGHCSAVSFAQWKKVPGTRSASVSYVFAERDYSKSGSAPFDNTYEWVRKYTAPGGSDRIQLGKSWVNGSKPNDCSEAAAYYDEHYVKGALVVLTIDCSAKRTTQSRAGVQASVEAACPAQDCTTTRPELEAGLLSVLAVSTATNQQVASRKAAARMAADIQRALRKLRTGRCQATPSTECAAAAREGGRAMEAVLFAAGGLQKAGAREAMQSQAVVSAAADELADRLKDHAAAAAAVDRLCR